jgi:hypothetical protein
MARANLPFFVHPTNAAREVLGPHLERAAVAAIRAVLKNRRSVDIAFQQIVYAGRHLALSSRVTSAGDLVVEIDLGDASLEGHVILQAEYEKAERKVFESSRSEREAARKLRQRRW